MDEKVEKILNELEELVCGKNENQENIEKAKESILKDLERNPRAIIYVSPRGSVSTGKVNELLACIALLIDQIRDEDITTEMLTVSFISGLTSGRKEKEKKEIMNDILETMKKFI